MPSFCSICYMYDFPKNPLSQEMTNFHNRNTLHLYPQHEAILLISRDHTNCTSTLGYLKPSFFLYTVTVMHQCLNLGKYFLAVHTASFRGMYTFSIIINIFHKSTLYIFLHSSNSIFVLSKKHMVVTETFPKL